MITQLTQSGYDRLLLERHDSVKLALKELWHQMDVELVPGEDEEQRVAYIRIYQVRGRGSGGRTFLA